jgi:dihydroorotase-like cyclic amidohydrolase
VLTVTRGTLQNTDVLLRNGKIAAIGKNLHGQVRLARYHRLSLPLDARHD